MAIYISGIEMPKHGMVVNIYPDGRVTNHFDEFGKTIGNAIPVPNKGRLISAKLLKADFTGNFIEAYPTALVHAMIDDAPTIIPAEEE